MTERPIPFTDEMVRAIMAGRKTQTRRVIKGDWQHGLNSDNHRVCKDQISGLCPYGIVGDSLWVKEGLKVGMSPSLLRFATYSSDGQWVYVTKPATDKSWGCPWRWKRDFLQSIFCPREASRITLEITEIRIERLHDITESDAKAEGVSSREEYKTLWKKIHGNGTQTRKAIETWLDRDWEASPWVWVISFKVVKS